ncbi:MAG: RDD family protein [Luteimonas sp.]
MSDRCCETPTARLGWRVLALFYDFWPALALWMLLSLGFTLGYTVAGHHDPHDNIAPLSGLQAALWLACWLATGAYAVLSWHGGGQTLGMRPWRLHVVAADGGTPSWRASCLRYCVGTASLLLAGLGFWWALFDRDRLTWHDRASGTRIVRRPRNPA